MQKIKAISVILLAYLSLPTILYAQDIQGRVTDTGNNPLQDVTIKLLKDSTTLQYATSDKAGMFTFKNLSTQTTCQLIFTFTGYERVDTTILTGSTAGLVVRMKQRISDLKEVVVSNRKPLIERKVDRLIFNVQNSMSSLSGDAMDVLKVTPLVMVENDALGIIGKGNVSVMINDRMLKISGDDLASYLRSIPSNNIESIEIITVPPSQYSAEGNAGILNIKLKKAINDYWSAFVRSIYTQATYATENLSAGFNYQQKKWTLSANASINSGSFGFQEQPQILYATQDWKSNSIKRSYSQVYNGRIQADYNVNKKLTIGTQIFYNNSQPHSTDRTTTSITPRVSKDIDSSLIGSGSQHTTNNNLSLNLNSTYKLGKDDQKIMVDLDYYQSENNNLRDFNSSTLGAGNQHIEGSEWLSRNKGDNKFHNISLNIDVEHKIRQFDINYGINYSSSQNRNALNATAVASKTDTLFHYFDSFQFQENTGALFLTLSRSLSDKLDLQAGLRAENTNTEGISNTLGSTYKNNYLKIFPTLYSSYKLNDHNVFSFGYGRRIDRPAYLSLNPFERYITRYYYSVGNPYLLPSFAHNLELNYSNNNNLNLSLYTNIAANQIAQTAIPDEHSKVVVDTMQNFYNMVTWGLTSVYSFRKYSWLESNFIFTGYYRNIRQHNTAIVPNYEIYVAYFSMDNNFKINKKVTSQLTFFYYSPQINGIFRRTPRYNVNLACRYKMNSHWEAAVLMSDIFKTTQGKLSAVVNGVSEYYNNYYDSRNLKLTISYRFGSTSVNPRQKEFGNEKEKQRAY